MSKNPESGPASSSRVTVEVPYYVHPEALEIGRRVIDMLDPTRTPRVVVRVEPALIVVDDEGNESSVLAHLVEVIE